MTISVGGLVSGLDTESIISQLLTIEQQPITQLQTKEAAYQLKLSTYGSLQSYLNSLNTALQGLDTASDFNVFSASSSDTDFFTVSADSDAVAGSYNIKVHSLAQAHKLTSSSYGGEESVGEGTLTIQVGENDAMTIDVADGDTIQDVADAINAEKGDVSAAVIFDGTDYFLTLTADDTGADNTIKIAVDDTGDGNDTDINGLSRLAYEKGVTENATLTETQEALDAEIDVDGVTGITRSSNTLNDVISGVTINLLQAQEASDTSSKKLTISRNTSAVVSAVDGFVSAYNNVVDFISTKMAYDAEEDTAGTLTGDATTKMIQRRLTSLINTAFSGMGSTNMLQDLGITRDEDGLLEVSTSTLTDKLDEDFDGVVRFFSQTTEGAEGFAVQMMGKLDAMLDSTDGTLVARQAGIQSSIDQIEEDIDRIQIRIDASEVRMRAQFNALELLMSNYQTTANYLTQQITGLQNLSTQISGG